MNKQTFCSYPFNTVFIGADKAVKTCCSAIESLGNLNDNTIDEILSGDKAREVKDTILQGKWHSQCLQCKTIESVGGRSERSHAVEKDYDKFKDIVDKDFFRLEMVDVRWSNTCNLACNYCYEYFSSQWASIKGIKVNAIKKDNEDTLLMFIEKNKDTVINVNMLGGEPLLQKQNSPLIEILNGKRFYVLTNLAVPMDSNKIANQLLKEDNAEWGVSFETVGKRYEYVRHNASWDLFLQNLEYVEKIKPDITLNAHPLYCTYSAFNLVEYYDFIHQHPIFSGVFWCVIQNIDELNVSKLSRQMKIKAIEEIDRVYSKYPNASGVDHLLEIKSKMLETLEIKPNGVDRKFLKWTKTLEKKFLTDKEFNFKELWPNLNDDVSKIKFLSNLRYLFSTSRYRS